MPGARLREPDSGRLEQGPQRAALFVDFDNIYSGLRSLDEAAADAFATNPEAWLTWLANYDPQGLTTESVQRSLLIRRVYLNPASYGRFRPYFVRSGFQVIDCPTLTRQGKNSADIQMVMDIIDTLEHPTGFDEFILLSGDSDFTPLLLKLRAHDRRTIVLAAGLSAAAYRAACDTLLSVESFIEGALGVGAQEGTPAPSPPPRPNRRRRTAAAPKKDETDARELIQEIVRKAEAPVVSSMVATVLRDRLANEIGADWSGAGSFRGFIEKLGDIPGVSVSWAKQPGYFFDPERHTFQSPAPRELEWASSPRVASVARLISDITEAPLIATDDFRVIFQAIADEVNANGYSLTNTSRGARDRCRDQGVKVARQAISFILKNLVFSNSLRGRPGIQPENLAADYADNLAGLARRARVDLSSDDEAALRAWVSGLARTLEPAASSHD